MIYRMMDNGVLFFFKQQTAYEMRISDWSSVVCSSDLDRLAQVDDEDLEPLALLLHLVLRRGAREQQHEVAVLGAAGPHLLAAPDIVVALAPGHGHKTPGVGAAGRLGHAERLQAPGALGDGGQVAPLSSDERRAGQECVTPCTSRCSPYPSKTTP